MSAVSLKYMVVFFKAVVIGLLAVSVSVLIVKFGIMVTLMGIFLPVGILLLYQVFKSPETGLWITFIANYFVLGLTRYIPAPLGLSIDLLLVLTLMAVFFKYFKQRHRWLAAKSDLTLLAAIWFLYALFQFVNPEAVSRVAWFYAMRGIALYMLLTVPLVFMLFNKPKHLKRFFTFWLIFALVGVIKGLQQKYLFLDPWEQQWLNSGGALTHLLFGKLRIFSFFTDAGQFGAAMGHSGVVFAIVALNEKKMKDKLIYGLSALLFFYALMISGTRGAIAVPVGGFFMYLLLRRNFRLLLAGGVLGVMVIVFFMFTTIGQNNYEIRRIRTAFDKDNPSLRVRIENQNRLKGYLATRPFGGGIGSAGNWGQRFTPNTFLANVPTDSWYVMIWAEQGIVGLMLHLFILFYVLIKSSWVVSFKVKNEWLRGRLQALVAGLFGIMLASYGNGVLGQMPTGIIIYMSMAFMFMADKLDRQLSEKDEPFVNQDYLSDSRISMYPFSVMKKGKDDSQNK
ncbi:O-antigen ligase domain-containing protein [Marinilabiliaceae bacterium JC017]|nr:O-antigen ligase domain-containing protein [Marinilabiliaceae bacterium JC017]